MLRSSAFILATLAMFALPAAAQDSISGSSPTTPAGNDDQTDGTHHAVDLTTTPSSSSPEHASGAPVARARQRIGDIELDGVLDEEAWRLAEPLTEFRQREPVEGAPPTQRTDVRILFDEEALYIGARMYDELGAAGVTARRGRRDTDNGSDYIYIALDPYHDHQSASGFGINPTGLRYDDQNDDTSWDPIWAVRTTIDEQGWVAEARIPFSQLRFRPGSTDPWGIQIERYINRLNERQVFSFSRLNEQGGPARWGHLEGIATPSTIPDRLELLPYVVAQAETHANIDADDPFAEETTGLFRVGADLKYQVTSSLTLSATINPDFGQAEVDPAVVNLSAFETFFPEKREFFIEGGRNFGYGNFWCFTCSNVSSLGMLFTRRIGRSPGGLRFADDAGDYYDAPSQTTILGAAKLTGRTEGGWSVGVLNATTAREIADVRLGTEDLEQEVEPLTNYFVGRLRREAAGGDLNYGVIATSVVRNFDDPVLSTMMNRHSEGLGFDTEYWWNERTYHLIAQAAFTNISGHPDAIDRAQRAPARYFQRPDRENGTNGLFTDSYDPTLTRMTGYGWYTRVAKDGGDWRWEAALNGRSPGFENNDIAFLTRSDYIWALANLNRVWNTPTSWYRSIWATVGAQNEINYEGDAISRQVHASAHFQLPNYWGTGFYTQHRPGVLDFRRTRGGPVVAVDDEYYVNWSISTDPRKSVRLGFSPERGWNEDGGNFTGFDFDIAWTPAPAVSLTLGPSYSISNGESQYVTTIDDPTATDFYGRRYVFADLHQRTLSLNTRMNVTFTPNMTLQLFAQPFISSNDYSEWKEYDRPRSSERLVYGEDVGSTTTVRTNEGRTVFVDPDGDGPAEVFWFDEPDFSLRSLRGNAVFRWEYMPGSTLFLVWTQDRASFENVGD
ncbi:MAG TPA: DUF5916 domain-containing protein, partial [Longimicrobiales bacterium]|nr:DUF5916 domain-containing protein [Longimicrobiales bacterium]